MRTLIVALILLVVLLVLSLMFIFQMRDYNQGLSDCEVKGGICTLKRLCNGPQIKSDCGDVVETGPLGTGQLSWTIFDKRVICCLKVKE